MSNSVARKPRSNNTAPLATNASENPSIDADAYDLATLGMECAERLRYVLSAIDELAEHKSPTIYGLARVGIQLADEYHNLFDVDRERALTGEVRS